MIKVANTEPRVSVVTANIARWLLKIMGWTVHGTAPDAPKWVMTAAPHTANIDTFLMILTALSMRVRLSFLVKDTLPFPVNKIVQFYGGIEISRRGGLNLVEQTVAEFAKSEYLVLGISPEGTRKKTEYWKTGFYYIALGANVPIAFGFLDYATKRCGVGGVLMPTGDIETDFAVMAAFYGTTQGKHPELFTNASVKPD
jgi:1-acyl-sn-glycerol-3-phosphate acyltransferase